MLATVAREADGLDLAERAASVEGSRLTRHLPLLTGHGELIKAAGAGVIMPTASWLDRRYEC